MKNSSERSPAPSISVVIPVYNAERFIGTTLESILSQDDCAFEIIVVDDGSTDGTASVLQRFSDERIKVIHMPNSGGPAKPRNVGILAATGKYISFFDADDIMLPSKLARSVAALERNPDAGMLFTNFSSVTENGDVLNADFLATYDSLYRIASKTRQGTESHIDSRDMLGGLSNANFIGTSSVVVRRSMFQDIHGFDESLKNGDDYDCWVRLLCRTDALFLDEVLHHYRIHSSSISHSSPARRLESLIRRHEAHAQLAELPPDFRRNSAVRAARYAQNVASLSLGLDNKKARLYAKKALKCEWNIKRVAFYLCSYLPPELVKRLRKFSTTA